MSLNSQEIVAYLNGEKFCSSLHMDLGNTTHDIVYRIEFLKSLVRGKKVIHVGCVDHIELISNKIDANNWLHGELIKSAEKVIGVDIDNAAVSYLLAMGYNNIYSFDITRDTPPDEISNDKWDYMIVGEVLEHVDNPVLFLKEIKEKFQGIVESFVITVPNAFSLRNFLNSLRNTEAINSDHRYWFTPYTLSKVCIRAGYKITNLLIARNSLINSIFPLKKIFFKKFPILRDTIVIIIG